MKLTERDQTRFFHAVSYLETALNAPPDGKRQAVWWQTLGKSLTIEQIEYAMNEAAAAHRWKEICPKLLIDLGRMMPVSRPQIPYNPTQQTPFGKAAAKLLATFTNPDSGMSHREYLLEVGKLAEAHNKPELQEWVIGRWDEVTA